MKKITSQQAKKTKLKQLPINAIVITHRFDQQLINSVNSLVFCQNITIYNNSGQNIHPIIKQLKIENRRILIIDDCQPINNFADIKNKLLKTSKLKWNLFMDSDEIIVIDLTEIESIINSNYVALAFKRKDIFWHKILQYGELWNYQTVRLINKDHARWVLPVHEIIVCNGKTAVAKQSFIYHYSHKNLEEFIAKINHYSYLIAQSADYTNFSKLSIVIQTLIYPITKFLLNFIIKLGFLDGYRGLIHAITMSIHSLAVRVLFWEKTNNVLK